MQFCQLHHKYTGRVVRVLISTRTTRPVYLWCSWQNCISDHKSIRRRRRANDPDPPSHECTAGAFRCYPGPCSPPGDHLLPAGSGIMWLPLAVGRFSPVRIRTRGELIYDRGCSFYQLNHKCTERVVRVLISTRTTRSVHLWFSW